MHIWLLKMDLKMNERRYKSDADAFLLCEGSQSIPLVNPVVLWARQH